MKQLYCSLNSVVILCHLFLPAVLGFMGFHSSVNKFHSIACSTVVKNLKLLHRCQLYSNVPMTEGDFSQIRGGAVPQSSDVVFLLEASKCNQYSLRRKSMPTIVNAVSKELLEAGISNNRYHKLEFYWIYIDFYFYILHCIFMLKVYGPIKSL